MGRKRVGIKGRNIIDDLGEEAQCSELAHFVSISDDDGSPLGSPKLSRTYPRSKSKTKGKQPVRTARKKTRAKNSRPKSPTPISNPKSPPVSPSVSISRRFYSLGGSPASPRDLEKVRAKYNIPHYVHLRVSRKGERLEHPILTSCFPFST